MSDVASLTITGRVTQDGEVTVTPNGTSVLKFSVACNRWKSGGQKTSFYDCVIWGRFGETKKRFTTRGTHLMIVGDLDIEEYEGANGRVRKPVLTVTTLEPTPGQGGGGGGGYQESAPAPRNTPRMSFNQSSVDTFDDDIPF